MPTFTGTADAETLTGSEGDDLLRGLGGTQDTTQAAQWLEKAAAQGVEEARAMLKAAG